MTRSKYGPAAGASGGAPVRPAKTLWVPNFLAWQSGELHALINLASEPLASHLYLVLAAGSTFKGPHAGECALTTYADLQARCRPPKPERGQWKAAPTLKTVRTALALLEAVGLVHRDAERNAAQGQLRLYLTLREAKKPTARTVPKSPKKTPAAVEALAKLAEVTKALKHA